MLESFNPHDLYLVQFAMVYALRSADKYPCQQRVGENDRPQFPFLLCAGGWTSFTHEEINFGRGGLIHRLQDRLWRGRFNPTPVFPFAARENVGGHGVVMR